MGNAFGFIHYFVFIFVFLVDFGCYVISSAESKTISTVTPKTYFSQGTQKNSDGNSSKTDLVWILTGTAAIVLVLAVGGFLIYKYCKRKERRNKNEAERYVVEVLQQLENENQVVQFLHMLELSSRETLEKERLSLNQASSLSRSEAESRHTSQSTSIIDRMNAQSPPTYDELFTDNASNFGTYNNDGFSYDDTAQWTLYGRERSVSQSINDDQDNVFPACNSTALADVNMKAKLVGEKADRKTEELHAPQLQQDQCKQQHPHQHQQQQLSGLKNDIVKYDNGEDEISFSRLSMDLNIMFSEENVIHWYSDETRDKYIRALSITSDEEEEVESFGGKEHHTNQMQAQQACP